MSQNHNHDKNLLDQIERAAHEKLVSGQPVLDDLARTIPLAKPAFQRRLENDMIAHLQSHTRTQQEDIMESTHVSPLMKRPRKRAAIPVTLVATLIMVMLGTSMLLFLRSPQPGQTGAVIQGIVTVTVPPVTMTPTPISILEYIIQPGDTLGSILVNQAHDAPTLEILRRLNPDLTAISAACTDATSTQASICVLRPGDVIRIPRDLLASENTDVLFMAVVPTIVPPGMIITEPFTATPILFQNQVTAASPDTVFTPTPVPFPDQNATISGVLMLTATPIPFGSVSTVSAFSTSDIINATGLQPVIIARQNIRRGEVITEEMLVQVYMPSSIVPESVFSQVESLVGLVTTAVIQLWQPVLREQVTADFQAGIMPDGTIGITIPVKRASDLEGIEAGSNVDVIIAMVVAEATSPTGEATSDTTAVLAATPAAGAGDPATSFQIITMLPGQLLMQRLVQNAPVIWISGAPGQPAEGAVPLSVTLAVDPEQAIALHWLIEADVSFLIVPSDIP